ncbi:Cu-oxidase-domain-containing protein [Suillus hirtellus]|nr:Cu-oxidase-domain-containing protein [Suillus hirtellus]
MFQLYVFLCFLASLQGRAAIIGTVSDLVVANGIVSSDGFTRSTVAVLAGGTHPGPAIVAQKGDTFKINVKNQLTNDSMLTSTSIRSHGLFRYHSNQMDGVSFVTQCHIAPGYSFLYDFNASEQVQYCDGLRGPLVIYNPNDPYSSWYDIDDDGYNSSPLVQRQVVADSVLINGVGRYDGGPDVPFAVIHVQPRKRYRFRLLNMACKPNYIFSIDSHNLTIIEVDGQYVEPLSVDSIQMYAAQRYSFILETNQPVDNHWEPDVRLDLVLGKNLSNFNILINNVQYTSPSIPHNFAVIRSAGSSAYNYVNPVMHDTVTTGNTSDRVTIRFITDNPRPWLLHCGLAIVFAEALEDVAASQPFNNGSKQLCPIYNSIPQQNFPLPPVD